MNVMMLLLLVQLESGDCMLMADCSPVTSYSCFTTPNSGEGDLHDRGYDDFERSIDLTDDATLYSQYSAQYTLTLYPTADFFEVYSTDNPITATVGAVLIILFTSLLFFLYDFNVQREFNAKKDLLAAKRAFLKFVSHEVRTPLNSVCMGLALMREEIAKAIA